MKFTFQKQLSVNINKLAVFQKIEKCIKLKRPKKVKYNGKHSLTFESKNMFAYLNFHLMQNIDFGYFELNENAILKYTIVSYRIWLLMLFPIIATYYMLQNILFSLIFGILTCLILSFIIYLSHRYFFNKIIKEISS